MMPSLDMPVETNQDILFWAFARGEMQSSSMAQAWAHSVSGWLTGTGSLQAQYFPDVQLEQWAGNRWFCHGKITRVRYKQFPSNLCFASVWGGKRKNEYSLHQACLLRFGGFSPRLLSCADLGRRENAVFAPRHLQVINPVLFLGRAVILALKLETIPRWECRQLCFSHRAFRMSSTGFSNKTTKLSPRKVEGGEVWC